MENPLNPGGGISLLSPARLQEGVASLSRGTYFKEASLAMTLSLLTESAARMCGVERVGIWALTDDQRELRCLELYELSLGRHSSGSVLPADRYPAFFRALAGENCIAADDPGLHPVTAELAAGYLRENRITALLDTPIYIRGELQGMLCLEQVATRVAWSPEHRLFAHAVANLVTLALVEFEAGEARRQARNIDSRLRAVFEGARDALILADGDSGVVVDANRRAERLFGVGRGGLRGEDLRGLYRPPLASGAGEPFYKLFDASPDRLSRQTIQRADGSAQTVDATTEVADLGDGGHLVLSIFRSI